MLVDHAAVQERSRGEYFLQPGTHEEHIRRALRRLNTQVSVLPFFPELSKTLDSLRSAKPRVVFNLTECLGENRRLDAAIVAVLDLLRLRYTGTGFEGLQMARDKAVAKAIVAGFGVLTPKTYSANVLGRVKIRKFQGRAIVKPRNADGSDGIYRSSLVNSAAAAVLQARRASKYVSGPFMCEEFIDGTDIYVSVLDGQVLPPVKLAIGRNSSGAPTFATKKLKHDDAYRARWRVGYAPAELSKASLNKVCSQSLIAFRALKLRDYARLDFRLDETGNPHFIEANPNPDLDPAEAFAWSSRHAGISYETLILRILELAGRRAR